MGIEEVGVLYLAVLAYSIIIGIGYRLGTSLIDSALASYMAHKLRKALKKQIELIMCKSCEQYPKSVNSEYCDVCKKLKEIK